MRTPPRWSLNVASGYLAILTLLALAIGVVATRFQLVRTPVAELTLAQAVRVIPTLSDRFVVSFAAAGLGCAVAGALLVVTVWRGRRPCLGLLLALGASALCLVCLWAGTEVLRDIEGVYYRKSAYVRLYLGAAWPLGAASVVAMLASASGLAVAVTGSRAPPRAPARAGQCDGGARPT